MQFIYENIFVSTRRWLLLNAACRIQTFCIYLFFVETNCNFFQTFKLFRALLCFPATRLTRFQALWPSPLYATAAVYFAQLRWQTGPNVDMRRHTSYACQTTRLSNSRQQSLWNFLRHINRLAKPPSGDCHKSNLLQTGGKNKTGPEANNKF